MDSPALDVSDPNSSNTKGSDVVCYDSKYQTSPVGVKFKQCVSCLQNSTATRGTETDQFWFLCEFFLHRVLNIALERV